MSNINKAAEILHRHHDNCNDTAEALAAAGVLAPDLPAPLDADEADRTGAHTATRWKAYTTDGRGEYEETVYVDAYEDDIYLVNAYDDLLDPESARALAHALLAAADHADRRG